MGYWESLYIYDNAGRLSAVTNKDTLLMAALYDGNDNRTFMMEYTPELKRQDSQRSGMEETSGSRKKPLSEENFADGDIQGGTGGKKDFPTGNGEESRTEEMPDGKEASGAKAFWYGVLCQMADIFLPAPTPFKAWLHEKMGFTDGISALWTEEIYEADLSAAALSVQEAESPFALMETIFAGTSGESLSSDAYRQVSYVNDINRANVQAVMEYTVNGGMGESVTSYSFGMQRESYTMTLPGLAAGNGETVFRVEGTYYYTGTGSVSNLTGTGGSGRSYAYALSGEACTFAMYQGETAAVNITAETYSVYAYNGEYTHQSIGLQYLRARYLNMETGTFLSRDTYAGRVWDILSQNRYTYAENNPVNYADPSGHVKAVKGIGSTIGSKVMGGLSNLKTSLAPAATKKSTGTSSRNTSLSVGYNPGTGISSKSPSLLDNIKTYNGDKYYNNLVARVPVSALMSTAGGGMTYAESVAAQMEARRCATYHYRESDLATMPIYAKVGDDMNRLNAQKQLENAEYIYAYLFVRGWSTEAICGLLGNIHEESHHNPGTWQVLNDVGLGYGLVQWDSAKDKFLKWILNRLETDSNTIEMDTLVNGLARKAPNELMNYELEYLLESIQPGEGEWIPTTKYDSPKEMELQTYITTKVEKGENSEEVMRDMALIFHGSYERSQDDASMREERIEWAYKWYKHFKGIEDIQQALEEEERIYGR